MHVNLQFQLPVQYVQWGLGTRKHFSRICKVKIQHISLFSLIVLNLIVIDYYIMHSQFLMFCSSWDCNELIMFTAIVFYCYFQLTAYFQKIPKSVLLNCICRRRAMPRQAQICDCLRLGLVHLGLGLVLCWISTIGVGWVGSAPPGRSCSGA